MAILMDGKAVAAEVKAEVKAEIEKTGLNPGLAVVIVGEDPASRIYVDHKKKDCEDCGIHSVEFTLAESVPDVPLPCTRKTDT